MNSSPTLDVFVTSIRKSSLLKPEAIDLFLEKLSNAGGLPEDPLALARKMIADGLLTRFQAEQLLQGRWRNFKLAGKYNVLERLSSGPMSTVLLCEHVTMRRLVALKLLPAEKAKDPATLTRFHREARAAARLRHPNVVAVHDLDSAGGLHFLVAEYVEGQDLERIVTATGPMPIDRAADCIRQAAEGLQHAHEMGMVHRDIKPGNLLLDRTGTVKLLDMGLARLFLDESDGMTKVDDGRMLLGTIDYLAPEQAIDSHDVDIRADIYSLGATAFFLLSGRTLFDGASTVQKLAMHNHRPPEQIVRELTGIPRGFADILVKMLAKDPADRFQSPAEVAQAMAPWSSQNIIPPSPEEMPRLCLATRRAVEKSRSSAVRIPAKPASKAEKLPAAKVSAESPILRRNWSAPTKKGAFPSRNQAIGLGVGGFALIAGIVVVLSTWGSSAPKPIEPTSTPSLVTESTTQSQPFSAPASTSSFTPIVAAPSNSQNGPLSQAEQDELYSTAEKLAASNRGVEAAEIFRRLIEVKNQGAWGWQRLTILDLQSNNLEKHRQDCETMLRLFGNTTDSSEAERVVKVCVLPPKPIELERAAELADRLLASDRSEFSYWSKTILGFVAIRKGSYEEAVSHLTEAESLNTVNQSQARCLNLAAFSIVYSRKKRPDLARKAYDEAMKIKSDETERGDHTEYSGEWHNWYSCAIALKEAENLLKFPPK